MSSGPNIPRSQRKRPTIELTLSDAAHAALCVIGSAVGCSRSEVVEALLRAEPEDRLRARVERWQRRVEKGDAGT